jgi:1,4-dihydroxy-6-naphthoate synthase
MAAEPQVDERPLLRISCSPDADDLFMFRAIRLGLVEVPGYRVELTHAPTNELNELASAGELDVVAISIAHYPRIADRYLLLPHGGSLGEGYGPVLVAREPMAPADLVGRRVAVPGLNTTAWAVLRMLVDVEPVVTPITPYELLFERLRSGEVDAALVIHEGRLTFEQHGFVALADLGVAWGEITGGLPLPLGGNAIRRDLGPAIPGISEALRASIAHGLAHRDEAIEWLLGHGGPLDRASMDRYLSMYANARTLDYGHDGRVAVEVLLEQAAALGIVPECEVDWSE